MNDMEGKSMIRIRNRWKGSADPSETVLRRFGSGTMLFLSFFCLLDFFIFGPHIPWEDGRFGMGEVRALTGRMTLAYFQLFCDPGRYDRESPTKQAGGLTASQAIQTVKLYRQLSYTDSQVI